MIEVELYKLYKVGTNMSPRGSYTSYVIPIWHEDGGYGCWISTSMGRWRDEWLSGINIQNDGKEIAYNDIEEKHSIDFYLDILDWIFMGGLE